MQQDPRLRASDVRYSKVLWRPPTQVQCLMLFSTRGRLAGHNAAMVYTSQGPHLHHVRAAMPWASFLSSLALFTHLFLQTGDNNGAYYPELL